MNLYGLIPYTLIGIGFVLIVFLSWVVLLQNKKIQKLQNPRFGFLGKPLAFGFGVFFSIGIITTQFLNPSADDFSVSDSGNQFIINIDVKELVMEENFYKISATPVLSGDAWADQEFDIYWNIKTDNSEYSFVETDLTKEKQGGFEKKLDIGKNIIKAKIFTNTKIIENTVTIKVD